MSDVLEIRVIEKIDFEDLEEAIDDGRKYVKLKSRDEPYKVDEDTYERVLAWIAEMNAKREELKPCPWCGETPTFSCYPTCDIIACRNPDCAVKPRLGVEHDFCRHDRQAIVSAWNGRAE